MQAIFRSFASKRVLRWMSAMVLVCGAALLQGCDALEEKADLDVILDRATCLGEVTGVDVHIDGDFEGRLTPGQRLSESVEEGSHRVEGFIGGQRGWDRTVNVGSGGFELTLLCS